MNTPKTIDGKSKSPLPPLPKMQVEWKEYFKSFCELHGGNPIEFEGRLLFSDGWTYSKTDYLGPEFPPPKGDNKRLNFMRLAYWSSRLKIVTHELTELRDLLKSLEELTRVRSAPIKHRITYLVEDETSGKKSYKTAVEEIDSSRFADRLSWLEADVEDCKWKIKAIEAEDTKQRS